VHVGRPGTHAQTVAVYRLIHELKSKHPGLEIESCSSRGARSDLGILAVTDRVWASDSNYPVERQDIQRWTQLLLPPELVGGHVGPTTAHSSGCTTDLSYRLATSLMGSAGFEWNIAECTEAEIQTITRWAKLYKQVRGVIHTGVAVHADPRNPALRVTGAVAQDGSEAVYTIASVATLEDSLPERIRLTGLDPDRCYIVHLGDEIGASKHGFARPGWLSSGQITLPGSVLTKVGCRSRLCGPRRRSRYTRAQRHRTTRRAREPGGSRAGGRPGGSRPDADGASREGDEADSRGRRRGTGPRALRAFLFTGSGTIAAIAITAGARPPSRASRSA